MLILLSSLAIIALVLLASIYHMRRIKDDWVRISCQLSPKNVKFLAASQLLPTTTTAQFSGKENEELTNFKSDIAYQVPLLWGSNPHLQNVFSSVIRSNPKIQYKREVIPDPLYEEPICLDWAYSSIDQGKEWTVPTLVILPGITGSITASYVNHFVRYFHHRYRIVVYTRPGCDPSTPIVHHRFRLNSHTRTIHTILTHVDQSCQHKSPLLVASFSAGGQNIARYLVEYGDEANQNLIGCFAVCNPFNTIATVNGLTEYPLIDRVMTGNIKQIIWRNYKVFETFEKTFAEDVEDRFNLQNLKRINSLKDLDQKLTKYLHNYKSVEEEYYVTTSVNEEDLAKIKRRIVFLHANDDQVVQTPYVPRGTSDNDNVILLSTKYGSHCSYAMMQSSTLPFMPHTDSFMEVMGDKILSAFVAQHHKN